VTRYFRNRLAIETSGVGFPANEFTKFDNNGMFGGLAASKGLPNRWSHPNKAICRFVAFGYALRMRGLATLKVRFDCPVD
ncbi:MAG: hypothetical protein AAGI63_05965, partial [Planctomycetota bacterium]